jgi:hypothetical protein
MLVTPVCCSASSWTNNYIPEIHRHSNTATWLAKCQCVMYIKKGRQICTSEQQTGALFLAVFCLILWWILIWIGLSVMSVFPLLSFTSCKTELFEYLEKHIPSKLIRSKSHLPWINHKIRKMFKKKTRLYHQAKKTNKWTNYKILLALKNIITDMGRIPLFSVQLIIIITCFSEERWYWPLFRRLLLRWRVFVPV